MKLVWTDVCLEKCRDSCQVILLALVKLPSLQGSLGTTGRTSGLSNVKKRNSGARGSQASGLLLTSACDQYLYTEQLEGGEEKLRSVVPMS